MTLWIEEIEQLELESESVSGTVGPESRVEKGLPNLGGWLTSSIGVEVIGSLALPGVWEGGAGGLSGPLFLGIVVPLSLRFLLARRGGLVARFGRG